MLSAPTGFSSTTSGIETELRTPSANASTW